MSGLQIHNLSKTLAGNTIVNDVSFDVAEGEFFVLLGPSGGGKTTILRLLCGLETADAGTIVIDGRDVTSLPPRDRNIGMVFQEYGLYPNMDVFHNIAYGLEARGVAKAEVQQRVTQAAAVLGLADMLRHSVVDLSGGEQQRVALARALAKDASVYLYDEPLSNLDAKLRHHTRRQIMDIHRRKGRPSLYVTHDQGEALAMANRIGVMAKGRLQQVGTPEQLLDRPRNMFVARFIGSPPMNLLRAQLTHQGGDYLAETAGGRLPLSREWQPALAHYGKDRVVVGLRPDHLAMASNGAGDITVTVDDVEALIGETAVDFRLANGERLTGMFAADLDGLMPGATARLTIASDGIELFDPDTELSLRAG